MPRHEDRARLPGEGGHLRLYLVYRVALGVALLLIHFGLGRGPVGSYLPMLFAVAVHLYLGLAVVALVLHLRAVGDAEKQGQLAVFLDIVLITVMMHASGGVQSGLGMLIAVSIALGSLGLIGHTALLFAALASLAVLTERIYSHMTGAFADTAYTQAGLLGASYFALALARAPPRQARRGERGTGAPARQSDLVQPRRRLNDYVIQQMRAGIVVIDAERDHARS
jgi:two-component system, NtrC family, sensor histidine kinase PilS